MTFPVREPARVLSHFDAASRLGGQALASSAGIWYGPRAAVHLGLTCVVFLLGWIRERPVKPLKGVVADGQ